MSSTIGTLVLGFPVSTADFWETTIDSEETCSKGHRTISGARFCTECGTKMVFTEVRKPTTRLTNLACIEAELPEDLWESIVEQNSDELCLHESTRKNVFILGAKILHEARQSCPPQEVTRLLSEIQTVRKIVNLEDREINLYLIRC